jgi:hypothetical protein
MSCEQWNYILILSPYLEKMSLKILNVMWTVLSGLTLEGDSGEEVTLWRLTSLSRWSKAKFKSPWRVGLCCRPHIFSTCHLWKCRYSARVYWNLSYLLLSILKVIFLESNPLRFIETLISFIRGFVYCLYMPGLK